MSHWHPASPALWQGRDDRAESPNALRLFQTITLSAAFSPENYREQIALLGFACDEGVKRNQGRTGAAGAPDALRKALANLASHQGHDRLVDLGNIVAQAPDLEGRSRRYAMRYSVVSRLRCALSCWGRARNRLCPRCRCAGCVPTLNRGHRQSRCPPRLTPCRSGHLRYAVSPVGAALRRAAA